MILRRFMQHIKGQNWFAVGLDVVVVIVGIFLGMQVTEWNEERKERIDLQQDLVNYQREVQRVISSINVFSHFHKFSDPYTVEFIESLSSPVKPENYKVNFEFVLRNLNGRYSPKLHYS